MPTAAADTDSTPRSEAAIRDRLRAARWSVGVGVAILLAKVTAWLTTGSVAIMSDALESIVHVGATLVMYVALRWSMVPPDRSHPYGHGKAGSFSVGFEGGLVAAAGALVLIAVVERLISGAEIEHLGAGMAWTAGAAVVNLILGAYLLRVAKRTRSSILRADGLHVLSDVWTSVAAVAGIGLVWMTGAVWIDLAVGAAAGVHLLLVGGGLVREAGRDLMDRSDPAELSRVLEAINERRDPEWRDVHRLRVHRVGERRYVDFHLVVPADWSVRRAHQVVEDLELHILERLEAEGAVTIHLDYPRDEDAASADESHAPFTLGAAIRMHASDPPVTLE